MSIFAFAIAACEPKTKCANCRHYEAIIADLQAWVGDLRESRDHWRELALGAGRIAASPNAQPLRLPDIVEGALSRGYQCTPVFGLRSS
jgi:hypothetical protein